MLSKNAIFCTLRQLVAHSPLIGAKQRGVDVNVLADRSQESDRRSQVPVLAAAGVPISIDGVPGIAHNKVMVIDGTSVLTGSFNWSQTAQTRNAENLVWIHDPQIARYYLENWGVRKDGSRPLQGASVLP